MTIRTDLLTSWYLRLVGFLVGFDGLMNPCLDHCLVCWMTYCLVGIINVWLDDWMFDLMTECLLCIKLDDRMFGWMTECMVGWLNVWSWMTECLGLDNRIFGWMTECFIIKSFFFSFWHFSGTIPQLSGLML